MNVRFVRIASAPAFSARPRDSQRSRLYAAERAAFGHAIDLFSITEVERYVERVWSMKRVQGAFPNLGFLPRVDDGRGRRSACASDRAISVPRALRMRWVIVHELAHIIAGREFGRRNIAWHGWQFAQTYLRLARLVLGVEAETALKAQFKARRVKHKAPRSKAPLTPEARAALIERMAQARAARAAKAAAVTA